MKKFLIKSNFLPLLSVFLLIFFFLLAPSLSLAHPSPYEDSDEECDMCFNECNKEGKKMGNDDEDIRECMISNAHCNPRNQDAHRHCTDAQVNNWMEYVKHPACDLCLASCDVIYDGDGRAKEVCREYLCRYHDNSDDNDTLPPVEGAVVVNENLGDKNFNGPCEQDVWWSAHVVITGKDNSDRYWDTLYTLRCLGEASPPKCSGDHGRKWDQDCANYLRGALGYAGELTKCKGEKKIQTEGNIKKCVENGGKQEDCEKEEAKEARKAAMASFFTGSRLPEFFIKPIKGGFGFVSGKLNIPNFIEDVFSVGSAVLGGLATLKIIFAGVMYATAAGNPQRISEAKSHILYAILGIGLIILMNMLLTIIGAGPFQF